MKKIIISLSTIVVIATIAVGGTIAYFSSTATSTGNTFTSGSVNLIFTDVNGEQSNPVTGPLFTLPDMKPGDSGEKTVGLIVDNNPTCGKVSINLSADADDTCTPAELIDEPTCAVSEDGGELNDAVNFAIWEDPNCNNVLDQEGICVATESNVGTDPSGFCAIFTDKSACESNGSPGDCMWTGETALVSGPLTEDKEYSIGELPTTDDNKACYGIKYCYGEWDGTECDGSEVNNASQTDSFDADLIINALQKRNQFPDGCPPVGDWPA